MKKIIAVDVDDVCLDLVSIWLELYNKEWNDNLTKDKITDWKISDFVKPECGKKVLKYIEDPSIYDLCQQIPGALTGINYLKTIGRVIFLTASTNGASGRKYKWLKENNFIDKIEDYVEAHDKLLIRADIMIDDKYETIKCFDGAGFLFTQPWNKKYYYPQRIDSWAEFLNQRGQK